MRKKDVISEVPVHEWLGTLLWAWSEAEVASLTWPGSRDSRRMRPGTRHVFLEDAPRDLLSLVRPHLPQGHHLPKDYIFTP